MRKLSSNNHNSTNQFVANITMDTPSLFPNTFAMIKQRISEFNMNLFYAL